MFGILLGIPLDQGNFQCHFQCHQADLFFLPRRGELTGADPDLLTRYCVLAIQRGPAGLFKVCAAMCSVSLVNCKTVQQEDTRSILQGAMHRSLKHQCFHFQCFAFSKTHRVYVGKRPIPEKLSMWTWLAAVPATNSCKQQSISAELKTEIAACGYDILNEQHMSAFQAFKDVDGCTAMLVAGSTLTGRISR